jgi:glycosyltransferase involved in cell wall biosynthesis
LRIANITATFPPHWTGAGLVCYYNARELARLGHTVHVYTAAVPGAPAEQILDGVQVHRLPPLLRIGNAPLLPALLRLRGCDLLHLHYPFITGAELVRCLSHRCAIPYIMTHHNDLLGDPGRRCLFNLYNRLTAGWVVDGARKWICVSRDHAASSHLARYYARRPQDLLEIPNGVDLDLFHPQPSDPSLRRSYGIAEGDFLVLFVGVLGRTHHYRRVDVLLHALHQLGHPAVHCLLAGDGDQRPTYEHLSRSLGLADRVHFAGRVNHHLLPGLYTSADVLVLPSTLQESFGMVLIESLACGTPVIASRLPGVRTVVADGVDGFLVNPGDPDDLAARLSLLLSLPPAARRGMGFAGRRKVAAKYAWEPLGRRLEAVYLQVLAGCRAQAASGLAPPA